MADSAIRVVAAIIRNGDQYLVAKRPTGKAQAGYWEFPGGKIEPQEAAEAALARELVEELDAHAVEIGTFLAAGEHRYGDLVVRIEAYFASCETTSLKCLEHEAIAWVSVEDLHTIELAPADLFLLRWLK